MGSCRKPHKEQSHLSYVSEEHTLHTLATLDIQGSASGLVSEFFSRNKMYIFSFMGSFLRWARKLEIKVGSVGEYEWVMNYFLTHFTFLFISLNLNFIFKREAWFTKETRTRLYFDSCGLGEAKCWLVSNWATCLLIPLCPQTYFTVTKVHTKVSLLITAIEVRCRLSRARSGW